MVGKARSDSYGARGDGGSDECRMRFKTRKKR